MQDGRPSSSPARRLSRRTQIIILAGAAAGCVAVAATAAAVGAVASRSAAAPPPPANGAFRPADDQWAALALAPAAAMTFHDGVQADGKIAVNDDLTTPVLSPYSGRVTRLAVEAGDHVRRGQTLFEVDAVEFVQGRNDLSTAKAGLATARAQLKLAQETEARQSELYKSGGGALKDWRQSQSDLIAAQGAERTAENALGAARSRLAILGQTPDRIRALEAAAPSQAVRPETGVPAPVAGVVVKRNLALGQYITAGAGDPQFLITDPSSLWLVAQVRESDAAKMRLGEPVEVSTPAYPGRAFAAKVTYVAATLDPDSHRLTVRATIANPDGALKPEMFAHFSIVAGEAMTSPGVPESAIVREGDAARVWTAAPDRTLRLRQIKTGVTNRGMVQVLAGLAPGERVVTRGALFIDRAGKPD